MIKIVYTPRAAEDLRKLRNDIADRWEEETSKKILKKIIDGINRLVQFPLSGVNLGKFIEEPTKYHYLFVEKNYIFFSIKAEEIHIVRAFHERQDFMRQLFSVEF